MILSSPGLSSQYCFHPEIVVLSLNHLNISLWCETYKVGWSSSTWSWLNTFRHFHIISRCILDGHLRRTHPKIKRKLVFIVTVLNLLEKHFLFEITPGNYYFDKICLTLSSPSKHVDIIVPLQYNFYIKRDYTVYDVYFSLFIFQPSVLLCFSLSTMSLTSGFVMFLML